MDVGKTVQGKKTAEGDTLSMPQLQIKSQLTDLV
jgi:hypothetical protein